MFSFMTFLLALIQRNAGDEGGFQIRCISGKTQAPIKPPGKISAGGEAGVCCTDAAVHGTSI